MDPIRVLIADDDPGMRLVLRTLIQKEPGFSLAAEAANGMEAIRMAQECQPDVAFLDIEMPGDTPGSTCSGIDCARAICSFQERVAVIFVTAHEEFMSDAFELYAFDYLVKPFRVERVRQTLKRLQQILQTAQPAQESGSVLPGRLTIRSRDMVRFLDIADILLIEREDRVSRIITKDAEYTTSDSLNELWLRLDPAVFLRSHRSYIINTRMVVSATPYGRWTYAVNLRGTAKTALITTEKLNQLQGDT